MFADLVVDGATLKVLNTCCMIALKIGVAPIELLTVRDLNAVTATTYCGSSAGATPIKEIACNEP